MQHIAVILLNVFQSTPILRNFNKLFTLNLFNSYKLFTMNVSRLQNQRSAVFIPYAVSGRYSGERVAVLPTLSFLIQAIGMLNQRVFRGRRSRRGILQEVPRRFAAEAPANSSPMTGKGRKYLAISIRVVMYLEFNPRLSISIHNRLLIYVIYCILEHFIQ